MRPTFALSLLASAAAALFYMPMAMADTINFTLSNPTQYGLAGNTFSFFATVSAPLTNTGVENLNGDSFSESAADVLNDASYLSNFPFFLNPGDTYTGLAFTVTLASAPFHQNDLGSFIILGGPTASSLNSLGTANFSISTVPEPSAFVLLGTGVAGLAGMLRRRRQTPITG